MRSRIAVPLVASLLASSLLACSPSRSGGDSTDATTVEPGPALPIMPVGHSGRWLTDATGRILLLHGVNVVAKNPPYVPASEGFSEDDAAWLADNGFRLVRLGILATGLMPTPGVVDTRYVDRVLGTVRLLAKYSIESLLDFHQDGYGPTVGSDGFPGWMTLTGSAVNNHAPFPLYYLNNPAVQQAFQSFWDDDKGADGVGLEEDYAIMFAAIAKEAAGLPTVLGYDLFNEPWPGTTYTPCLSKEGCASLERSELAPVYAKAVHAIRAAGDTHLVFGEPFVLFNYGNGPTDLPVPGADDRAGMSFHVYPLGQAMIPDVLDQATAWANRSGGALLNTEWGATEDEATIATTVTDLDSALVPWIFWSFCCEVIDSFASPPSGKNLVASTIGALVEAHPLAVAGTPETLTTDPVAHTLSFTWSTARADGGSFAAGTVTSFEVPKSAFPGGYEVTVTGGAVASPACAPLLTVMAEESASRVTVAVASGGRCP
jgi:endoglycosylceramidase